MFTRTWYSAFSSVVMASSLGLAVHAAATKSLREGLAVLGFFAAGWAVLLAFRVKLPLIAHLFLFTTLLNALGWVYEFYSGVPGFDEIAHGLTTTAITGLVAYVCFRTLLGAGAVSTWQLSVMVFSLGVSIGALWEIIEWFSYLITGRPGIIKSLNDTVSDLIWDCLGAAFALPLLWRDIIKQQRKSSQDALGLFRWRWALALAGAIGFIWNFAENRADDALHVASKRAVIEAHRSGQKVEILGRFPVEDLYQSALEDPESFVGKNLVFRKTVSRILGPEIITIDADGMVGNDELVVVVPSGELPEKLRVGDQIEILGIIKLAGQEELAVLARAEQKAAEGQPLIVAEAVLDYAGDE